MRRSLAGLARRIGRVQQGNSCSASATLVGPAALTVREAPTSTSASAIAAASAACAAPAPTFGAARWWSSTGDAGGEGGSDGGGQRRGKCVEGRASPDDEPQLFIRQLQEAGEQGDLARVFDLVEGRGEDIDEEGVEVALAQVAHCSQLMKLVGDQLESEVHHRQTFQTLVDMAAHGAKRFSAPAKARIVSLLGGQLKWRDEVALDELGRSLMAGVQDLGPTHLSLLVGGLAAAGHSPGVLLLDAVRDRIRELGPSEVPAQQADRIDEALRKLGHPGLAGEDEGGAPSNPPAQHQPDRAQSGADYV